MGLEVVGTKENLAILDKNRQKWQNPNYPNLQADIVIPAPPVTVDKNLITGTIPVRIDNTPLFLRIAPVPTSADSVGQDGDMSYDASYFYLHTEGEWKRASISEFVPDCNDTVPLTGNEGDTAFNSSFFYIYSIGEWRKVAISQITIPTVGSEGDVMYDADFFYIYTNNSWRRVAITEF